MSAESHAHHEPTPTAEAAPVAGIPETAATSGLAKVIKGIQNNPLMRPFVVRNEFRQSVIDANAKLITDNPTDSPNVVQNFVNAHRTPKKVHTDTPKAEQPAGQTQYRSGAERYEALNISRDRHHLIELRNRMSLLQQAYPGINLGGDKESFEAAISGMPWRGRAAARKAFRDYHDHAHHQEKLFKKFGLDAHGNKKEQPAPPLTPEERAEKQKLETEEQNRREKADSFNKLAKLQGDVEDLRRDTYRKVRYVQSYTSGTYVAGEGVKRKKEELATLINSLRASREDLNKHTYAHIAEHDPDEAEHRADGSIVVRNTVVNSIPGTWAIYEDGRTIQYAEDGTTVLAKYRPNGVRYYIDEDRMRQKYLDEVREELRREPDAEKVKKTLESLAGKDLIAMNTDFEAAPQAADMDFIRSDIQKLKDQISKKQSKGKDATDEIQQLRNATTRLSMAQYDYLYNSPDIAERPREGTVATRGKIHGVWGDWDVHEDGSSICRDQDGEVVARFNPDGALRSMRSDPYAIIDTLPPIKPSSDTFEQRNTDISRRQRLINESRKFIDENKGNPAQAGEVKTHQKFIASALESLRSIREDYNAALYEQLSTNLPADAQVRRDGAIIVTESLNGYTGRWVIRKNGSALYLGDWVKKEDITDPDDDSQIKPAARFHRNGYRYQ